MYNLNQLWRQTLRYIRQAWRQLFFCHLAFVAMGVVLFTPLIGLTGRLLLQLSGKPALADQDIAYFLLTPAGWFALILFAALLVGIMAFEQASLMRIAMGAMCQQRISTVDALIYTASRAQKVFLFSARLVVRVLVLTLPFLAVAAGTAWLLISKYDINFYLSEKPPEFWTAAILIVVVLITMVIMLLRKLSGWSLALPLLLFGNVSPAESFTSSLGLTENNRKLIFAVLAIWAGLAILLELILFGAVDLIGSWIVPHFSESISQLVMVLGGLSALWIAGSFLITAFTSGSFACLIVGFHKQIDPDLGIALIKDKQVEVAQNNFRLSPQIIVSALIIGVVIAVVTGAWLMNDIQANNSVIIAAHRGAAGKAPENTLAAIHQAIEDQADWIEIDVQETADGEIVVIHDSDFMKLAGNPVKVWDATLAQMGDIDIGSWFAPGFSQQRVPTLKQVLETARGKARVVIELKYYGHDEKLEQRVVEIVEQTDMVNATAIMSLKYDAVKKVRALRPGWRIGLLSATAIGDLTRLDADFLAVAMGMASGGFVRRAHDVGKLVFVWTVNDPVSMSRMMSMGVDGVITDEPAMARKVLVDRAELNSAERLLIHTALLFDHSFTPQQYRDQSP